jgi:hypothetical protein
MVGSISSGNADGLYIDGLRGSPTMARVVADLKLEVVAAEGRKASIIALAMVDGKQESVEIAHERFANPGAAVRYLRHRSAILTRTRASLAVGDIGKTEHVRNASPNPPRDRAPAWR